MKINKKHIIGLLLVGIIIAILLSSGPVKAVLVDVFDAGNGYYKNNINQSINLLAIVDIYGGERIPIVNMSIRFYNASNVMVRHCAFSPLANKLSTCSNIGVKKVLINGVDWYMNMSYHNQSSLYGYGYGYNINDLTSVNYTHFNWTGSYWSYGGNVTGYDYNATKRAELMYNVTWNISSESSLPSGYYRADFHVVTYDGTQKGRVFTDATLLKFLYDKDAPVGTLSINDTDKTLYYGGQAQFNCSVATTEFNMSAPGYINISITGNTSLKKCTTGNKKSCTVIYVAPDVTTSRTIICYFRDAAGNHATATDTINIVHSSSSEYGSGTTGGGETPTEEKPTYDLESQDEWIAKEPVTFSAVSEGETIGFTMADGSHKITIDNVDETAGTVTITITSDPVKVTLSVNETKEVDVDGDGTNDISVKLNGISNGKADITIQKLAGYKPKEEGTPKEEEKAPTTPTKEEKAPSKGYAWIWWVLAGIIIVVIVVIIALKLKKGSKKGE